MRTTTAAIGILVLAVAVVATGCTHNELETDGDRLWQRTSDASVALLDAEGNQSAAYHGLGASVFKQDPEGNWTTMPGPVTMMTVPMPEGGLAYIVSPKDTSLKGVKWTPKPADGQPAFEAAEISTVLSAPLERHVDAITVALAALEGMTRAEAEATIRKWEEAGKISDAVLTVVQALVPLIFAP